MKSAVCEKDIICVSMGGNDIALRPTPATVIWIIALLASPRWLIELGLAPGLHHFVGLFRDATASYLKTLLGTRKPRAIIACMLYYLDEKEGGSWADFTLSKLGYNSDPTKLQLIMREIYKRGTSHMQVGDIPVVPVPLYEALDGKDTNDYVQRVEPSAQGGQKMAKTILDHLLPALELGGPSAAAAAASGGGQAPRRSDRLRGGSDAGVGASATAQPTVAMPSAVHQGKSAGLW